MSSPTATYHRKSYPTIDPKRPELSTKGKNVVVTGSGSGIGAEIARAYARSGASNLALVGRTAATLQSTKLDIEQESPETKVHILTADLTDAEQIRAALKAFSETVPGGKIDILVANAGYLHALVPLLDLEHDDFWRTFEINIKGNYNLLRAFKTYAATDAAVISVNSAVAHVAPLPGHSGYSAAKAALAKMLDYFRFENPGIRVVQFHPGVVVTEMSSKSVEAGTDLPFDDISLPAAFAVWAASPEASFVNGKYLWPHWDVDELKVMSSDLEDSERLTIGLNL
ncbi:hypothetical protein BGZ63DRAFT_362995 [Mariannaea sp. PMI_226]|nr:hypothetical protein BGZ63DRAFT_362995 [Mariannaea sp. PMI_226]